MFLGIDSTTDLQTATTTRMTTPITAAASNQVVVTATILGEQHDAIDDAMEHLLIRPTQQALVRLQDKILQYFKVETMYFHQRRQPQDNNVVEKLLENQQYIQSLLQAAVKPSVTTTTTVASFC